MSTSTTTSARYRTPQSERRTETSISRRRVAELESGPDLFNEGRPAAMLDPETSWAAGRADTGRKREERSRLRGDIFRLLQLNPDGLTDDQLHTVLPDDDKGSIAKRRLDLCRMGAVVDSRRTRPTRRGSKAIVWRLA